MYKRFGSVSTCFVISTHQQSEFNFELPPFFFPEPSFTLNLEPVLSPQMTAEPTELACHVTNITHLPHGGRLGVTWEHTALPGTFTSAFAQINNVAPQTKNCYKSSNRLTNLFLNLSNHLQV